MNTNGNKRPIDKLRDAAFTLRVGFDDSSSFVDFYKIGEERMLWVKAKGVYEITLADQIDPARTNAAIPHTQQRVLDVGGDDEIVQRVLLTAKVLFNEHAFGKQFNRTRALELAYEMVRDLLSMRSMKDSLIAAEAEAATKFEAIEHDKASLQLPSVADINARFDAFTVKANHVAKSLRELAELFYGSRISKKWVESLQRLVEEDYGASSAFADFMKRATPFLLFTINMRNAAEHPDATMRLIVCDYTINDKGDVVAPTVEVVHPSSPQPRTDAVEFMELVTDSMLSAVEWMMAHLSASNVQPFGIMTIVLSEIPEGQRKNGVRFGYQADFNGKLVPFA